MALTTLITYDISRDDNRARVAAYLQHFGDRIQRSVYLCAITPDEIPDTINRLTSMINPDTDAIHIIPTCGACWAKTITLGQATLEPDQPCWITL